MPGTDELVFCDICYSQVDKVHVSYHRDWHEYLERTISGLRYELKSRTDPRLFSGM